VAVHERLDDIVHAAVTPTLHAMRFAAFPVVASLIATLLACAPKVPGTATHAEPPRSGSSSEPLTIAQACGPAHYAGATCDGLARCPSSRRAYADRRACLEAAERECRAQFAPPGSSTTAAQILACAELLRTSCVAVSQAHFEGACRLRPGLAPLGAPCMVDAECASTACDRNLVVHERPGACWSGEEGERCLGDHRWRSCASGLSCNHIYCEKISGEGEPCVTYDEFSALHDGAAERGKRFCAESLECRDHVCLRRSP
jgi:hypothetical protein